jgi:uncharacterized membrane protein
LSTRTANLLALAILIAAAAVRLAGINQQLWLDEIWSIRLSQTAGSPAGVFLLHHDNNHWLNTLYLQCLGPGRPWWTYHLLAECTGIGTVLLGFLLARRRGIAQGLAALILLGFCEFFIEFSTDARGYAPAGFFALLCLWLLEKHLPHPRRWTAALMASSAVAGLLSHLTFVVILAGLIVASVIALIRRRSWIAALSAAAIWWAVPIAVIAGLYWIDVRLMVRGGGPPTPSDLAAQASAMILGLPIGSPAACVFAFLAMALCAAALWRLYRAADPAWPLFLTAWLFAPAVLFLWPKTDYIHPRYIYVALPLLMVLLALELGRWLSARWPTRLLAAAALAGFVAVNLIPLSTFLRAGRGDYVGALRYMIDHTAGSAVIIGTDQLHPTSTVMVAQYYAQYSFPPAPPLMTLKGEDWTDQWPQWLIVEQEYGPTLITSAGVPFIRRAAFPSGAVADGISWTLYEVQSGAPYARPDNLRSLSAKR